MSALPSSLYHVWYNIYIGKSWAGVDDNQETHVRTASGNQMQESKKLQRVALSDLVCIPGLSPETDTMGAPSRSMWRDYDDHDHEMRCR